LNWLSLAVYAPFYYFLNNRLFCTTLSNSPCIWRIYPSVGLSGHFKVWAIFFPYSCFAMSTFLEELTLNISLNLLGCISHISSFHWTKGSTVYHSKERQTYLGVLVKLPIVPSLWLLVIFLHWSYSKLPFRYAVLLHIMASHWSMKPCQWLYKTYRWNDGHALGSTESLLTSYHITHTTTLCLYQ